MSYGSSSAGCSAAGAGAGAGGSAGRAPVKDDDLIDLIKHQGVQMQALQCCRATWHFHGRVCWDLTAHNCCCADRNAQEASTHKIRLIMDPAACLHLVLHLHLTPGSALLLLSIQGVLWSPAQHAQHSSPTPACMTWSCSLIRMAWPCAGNEMRSAERLDQGMSAHAAVLEQTCEGLRLPETYAYAEAHAECISAPWHGRPRPFCAAH